MALFRSAYRAEIVAGALVVTSLVLLALPESRQDSIARAANHVVLLPLANARNVMGGYVGLRDENTRLRSELQAARLELGATEGLRLQNRDLSRMLEFRDELQADVSMQAAAYRRCAGRKKLPLDQMRVWKILSTP